MRGDKIISALTGIAYVGFELGEESYNKIICDLLKERSEHV